MRYNLENDTLTIFLEGELNSYSADPIGNEIDEITKNNQFKKLVLDLEMLRYISSAGLRVVLKLKQQYDDVSIINASLEVYDIFQMTGFANTMPVQKALRKVDISHAEVIGDGYFLNSRYDINYLGDATDQGFYMNTDVGYLRFIFYFGIIGLIPMMGVIVYSAIVCMRYFPYERLLFFLALLVGLIVWVKVSTDIFLFFALFLAAAVLQDKTPQMDLINIPYD